MIAFTVRTQTVLHLRHRAHTWAPGGWMTTLCGRAVDTDVAVAHEPWKATCKTCLRAAAATTLADWIAVNPEGPVDVKDRRDR